MVWFMKGSRASSCHSLTSNLPQSNAPRLIKYKSRHLAPHLDYSHVAAVVSCVVLVPGTLLVGVSRHHEQRSDSPPAPASAVEPFVYSLWLIFFASFDVENTSRQSEIVKGDFE